jgi:hypothetical protein
MERQDFSWGTFRWYFDFYTRYGLEAVPFFWSRDLSKHDVDMLWHYLWSSEVVILGGGNPQTGLTRYKYLGERFDGEPGKFGRLLHERAQRGLLTVGFSAGADQLAEYLFSSIWDPGYDCDAFGLARNVLVTLHHEDSRNGDLQWAARRNPHCLAFGLPNDSGLNVDGGVLPSGNLWQVIEFVIDNSWDDPTDYWHIKTRQGARIPHFYADGRHWAFNGGDLLVRVQSPDRRLDEAWIARPGARLVHYGSQQPSGFHSIEHVLASH